jgi:hypothetical protein
MENKDNDIKQSYYKLNKDKMSKCIICDICRGSYNMVNKNHHEKTKKHKFWCLKIQNDNLKTNQ